MSLGAVRAAGAVEWCSAQAERAAAAAAEEEGGARCAKAGAAVEACATVLDEAEVSQIVTR